MIPFATTTVTIRRPAADSDPEEEVVLSVVKRNLAAHISAPSGSDRRVAGDQEQVDAVLLCDTSDVRHTDTVTDDGTGENYEVAWVRPRQGLGLDHTKAGLVAVKGAAAR